MIRPVFCGVGHQPAQTALPLLLAVTSPQKPCLRHDKCIFFSADVSKIMHVEES